MEGKGGPQREPRREEKREGSGSSEGSIERHVIEGARQSPPKEEPANRAVFIVEC